MLPAVGHRLISSVILCNTSSGIGVDSNLLLATPLLAYERILRRSWMIDSNDLSIKDGDETESVFLVTLKDTSDKQHSVLTLRCTGRKGSKERDTKNRFQQTPHKLCSFRLLYRHQLLVHAFRNVLPLLYTSPKSRTPTRQFLQLRVLRLQDRLFLGLATNEA